jgi:hypothetical protein
MLFTKVAVHYMFNILEISRKKLQKKSDVQTKFEVFGKRKN